MHCASCGTRLPEGARACPGCGHEVDGTPDTTTGSARAAAAQLETLRRALAGEYAVERELGRGGMAVVYKAEELELGRTVALKVLPAALAHDERIAERFKREARMTAALEHPNVMPVYRVGQADGVPFIAMRYVEGRALDEIIEAHGALPLPVIQLVLRGAAAALAAAHEHGIIHRDVKGGNIMIDVDGRVLVTDFGIARAVEDASITQTGVVVGTPHFMSPEQCAGKALGPQTDQYALGVVAYQMLTGAVPFDADSLAGIMQHHFFTPVPDVTRVRAGVPRALGAVVERALEKRPERRYATTRDMVAALEAVPLSEAERREGERLLRELARGGAPGGGVRPSVAAASAPTTPMGIGAGPRGWWRALPRGERRIMIAAFAVAATLVLLLAGAGWAAWRAHGERVMLRQGVVAYQAGRRAEARAAFARVAREHPDDALAHVYLGRLAREEGDFVTAKRELGTAIQLDPRSGIAMREMGAALLGAGEDELARRFYLRALRLDPRDRTAQGYMGCALLRLGRTAEARRAFAAAGPGPWDVCEARAR